MDATLNTTAEDLVRRPKLVLGDNTYASVTDKVCGIVEERKTPLAWWVAFVISGAGVCDVGRVEHAAAHDVSGADPAG